MEEKNQENKVGEVFNYFKNVKVAAVKVLAPIKVGDKLRFVGGEKDIPTTVESMQVNGQNVEEAKAGDEVGILVPEDVHKEYRVYKVE